MLNDEAPSLGGTYTYIGQLAVPVSAGDVLSTNASFSANYNSTYGGIRVTRSTVSGSGTVGTAIGYSFSSTSGSKYQTNMVVAKDSGLSAGTWYYKLWSTGSYSNGSQNYNLMVTKTK